MFVFPRDCPSCPHQQKTEWRRCYACATSRIHAAPPVSCPKCAQIMRDGQCKSLGCRRGLNHFSKVHAVGPLSGALGGGISRLKSAHVLCMVQPLGKLLAGYLLERLPVFAQYDFLLPVPKHPARVAEKGFDQVRELFDVACQYITPQIRCDNLCIAPYLIQNRTVKSLRTDTKIVEERYQEVSGCFDLRVRKRTSSRTC